MFLDIISDGATNKLVRKSTRGESLFCVLPSSAQDPVQDVATEDWTHFTISDRLHRNDKTKRIRHGHVLKQDLKKNDSMS